MKRSKRDRPLPINVVADMLGVHRSTVYRYIVGKELKAVQFVKGGCIRVYESELKRFIDSSDYQENEEVANKMSHI